MCAQCQNCSKEQGLQRHSQKRGAPKFPFLGRNYTVGPLCQFLLAMLSLVKIASCWLNHINTLILRGTLAFQMCLLGIVVWSLQRE